MWLAAVVFIPLVIILSLIAIGIPANLFLLKSKFSAGFASSSTVIQALIFLSVSLMFLTVSLARSSAVISPSCNFLFNESMF
jgi:hypothetical protein